MAENPFQAPSEAPQPPKQRTSIPPEGALVAATIVAGVLGMLCGVPVLSDALCLGSVVMTGALAVRMLGMGKEAG